MKTVRQRISNPRINLISGRGRAISQNIQTAFLSTDNKIICNPYPVESVEASFNLLKYVLLNIKIELMVKLV